MRSLVDCGDNPSMPGTKDPFHCFVGNVADQNIGAAYAPAVTRTLELLRAKVPNLPTWEQILFFRANFTAKIATPFGNTVVAESGPMFFREQTSDSFVAINEVAGIGLDVQMRDKPYVGYMDAGNTAAMGEDPVEDIYEACGPVMSIPVARFFNDATVCPPGLFTYFDALAQATAMIYGPYLRTSAGLRRRARTAGSRSSRP